MEDEYKKLFGTIFNEFAVLDSGLQSLIKYITSFQGTEKQKYMRIYLLKELALKKVSSLIIDSSTVLDLIKEVENQIPNENNNKLNNSNNKIIKSFNDISSINEYMYDSELIKCKYIYSNCIIYIDSIKDYNNTQNIFSDNAIDKPKMFQTQFNMVKYFLLENPNYKTKFQNKQNAIELTQIGSLQGMNEESVTVFGMLLKNEQRKILLQDTTSIIEIDISNCEKWGKGYFTPGCCIICQGDYKNGILKAKLIIHPPVVWNNKSFEDKYEKDFFGGITKAFKNGIDDKNLVNNNSLFNGKKKRSNFNEENYLKNFLNHDISRNKVLYPKTLDNPININLNIEKMKNSNYDNNVIDKIYNETKQILEEEFILIISNPDLTNLNVLKAIEKIVEGYISLNPNNLIKLPFMIIFMGNFSNEQSFEKFKLIESAFENLTNILIKNKRLIEKCYFIFMPGPNDFSLFNGFPKHPYMPFLIEKMKKKIPNIINASNPCRFNIFGKEIVFFRDDLEKKLSRNSIKEINDNKIEKDYYVHTILEQGCLSPLILSVTPRIWNISSSMIILPLPDILILGDVVTDFSMEMENDMIVVNPGNFTKDFSFSLIYPLKMISNGCKIDL